MQQSSASQSLHLSFWGLRKIVACSHSSSQCLLVSTIFGTVSSLHPTSFLMIFILVYICMVKKLAFSIIELLSHTCEQCEEYSADELVPYYEKLANADIYKYIHQHMHVHHL